MAVNQYIQMNFVIYYKYICLNVQFNEVFIMYFYQRLTDIREDNDRTQVEIAKILSITQQQYQLYESGKREMPMHHFVTLAKFYNVSLDYLAGVIDKPRKLL